MGFENTNFNNPIYTEEEIEPQKILIISCEGSNTEPEYFQSIKNKLSDYIDILLEIEIIPKEPGASEPQDVVSNLDEYIKDKYDYKPENDEKWVVWDREKVPERKKDIEKMIPVCLEKNYNIAMTNPLFEFWLLLHVDDISTYDNDELFKNEKISNNKKFIDKKLFDILGSYNKKKNKFNTDIVSMDNIKKAILQEKLFENQLENIIDHLGSNIGTLVSRILKI